MGFPKKEELNQPDGTPCVGFWVRGRWFIYGVFGGPVPVVSPTHWALIPPLPALLKG